MPAKKKVMVTDSDTSTVTYRAREESDEPAAGEKPFDCPACESPYLVSHVGDDPAPATLQFDFKCDCGYKAAVGLA